MMMISTGWFTWLGILSLIVIGQLNVIHEISLIYDSGLVY